VITLFETGLAPINLPIHGSLNQTVTDQFVFEENREFEDSAAAAAAAEKKNDRVVGATFNTEYRRLFYSVIGNYNILTDNLKEPADTYRSKLSKITLEGPSAQYPGPTGSRLYRINDPTCNMAELTVYDVNQVLIDKRAEVNQLLEMNLPTYAQYLSYAQYVRAKNTKKSVPAQEEPDFSEGHALNLTRIIDYNSIPQLQQTLALSDNTSRIIQYEDNFKKWLYSV
jgi:hypothetical protein